MALINPRAIARRLIDLAAEADPIQIMVDGTSYAQSEVLKPHKENCAQRPLVRHAKMLVARLECRLAEGGWNSDISMYDQSNEGRWVFGTAMTLRGPRLEIHQGFLEPVLSIPILERVSDTVAHYLLTVDDGEDYLKRETHSGVGWHYHYLDWNKRRSDVVLCWDTRWVAPSPQPTPAKQRGLFVEKHAEGGKPFSARPDAWGERKRRSMYSVCVTDLHSRNIEEYRCAANKSQPVYPPEATLTPHPSQAAMVTIANQKGRNAKKRGR